MRTTLGGNITVVAQEQWYAQLRAGRGFQINVVEPAAAGTNSLAQLMNPAASGVRAIVRLAVVSPSVASRFQALLYNTGLTTDVGAGVNLLSGGAAAACHGRRQQNAGALGALIDRFMAGAVSPVPLPNDWIAELAAGQGLVLMDETVNVNLFATFRWIEVPT